MKVRDILRHKGTVVITTTPETSLYDALGTLVNYRVGALVVMNSEDKTVGIITERDVLRVCATHSSDLDHNTVAAHMTTQLIIGVPEDEVGYVMGIMTNNRIRHLPIMEGERLKGIVSIGDLVKA